MILDFDTTSQLRHNHPAWRLLMSDHAPFVVSFLSRVFIAPNERMLSQSRITEALEDDLYALRERLGEDAFPKSPIEYLNDWASDEKRWLRKAYVTESDEPHFDLTPSTEKTIIWISNLADRPFVGTESRLLTIIELLRQISEGTETDPDARVAMLMERREKLDREIQALQGGEVPLLHDTAIKDRFQQFTQAARELLADFREVEQNFRALDRRVRERIALWDGSKGALLEEIMGERDAISESDQGKSFRTFWDFLMSQRRQQELTQLLETILRLPAVCDLRPDSRLRRVHYDWMEAGEQTQRTVSLLSQQLRRFLDDKAWLENRRIMDIIRSIETRAIALRDAAPPGPIMTMPESGVTVNLPFERPLFKPPASARVSDMITLGAEPDLDLSLLFSGVVVDRAALERHIVESLRARSQVTLPELVAARPLHQGLAELVTYLQIASERHGTVVDESVHETVEWRGADGAERRASLPRIILVRR